MKIWQRILLFLVVSICVMILPWWLSALLVTGLVIYIPMYVEALFYGFLFDTLYASQYVFPYIGLTLVFIFVVLVMFIRPRIRMRQNKNYV